MKKSIIKLILIFNTLILNLNAEDMDNIANSLLYKFNVESLEYQKRDRETISWNVDFYVGYSLDKLYIYTEGEKRKNSKNEYIAQLLYSKAVSPFLDIQFGIEEMKKENSNIFGVVGINGILPYYIETKSYLRGNSNTIGLNLEFEYEIYLTQKLLLIPSIELLYYTKDYKKMEIEKGLSTLTSTLKLLYNFTPQFSTYIGLEANRNYSNSSEDEEYLLAGIKFWF